MTTLAYVPDLMDRSRLNGLAVTFVASPDELLDAGSDDTVVVDLGRPGVLDVLARVDAARTIGFGSHVDKALLDQARQAGCDDVMPRSDFFRRARELLV